MFFPHDPDAWARVAEELKKQRASKKPEAPRKSGASCQRCDEFNEYAELDADGKYNCWQCRRDPWR